MRDDQPRDLTSWKEIAAHLDVTVRTAQEWEKKRGLPVRRVPGGRGRVFMRLEELEEWLLRDGVAGASRGPESFERASSAEVAPASGAARPPVMSPLHAWLPRPAVAGALVVLLVALAAALVVVFRSPESMPSNAPARARVTRNTFVVENDNGVELWHATFPEGLTPGAYADPALRGWDFLDANGDGRTETLFLMWPENFASRGALICFDDTGEELWRYTASADNRVVGKAYENIYRPGAFLVVRRSNGEVGVAVSSIHYSMYPTEIALISATSGERQAGYWHSGHIGDKPGRLAAGDRNGDGRQELYALGVSNAYDQATLVVLDLERMGGASIEQRPDYQLQGYPAPHEITRILFPRSSMSVQSDDYNVGDHVWLTPGYINVEVRERLLEPGGPELIYKLRPDDFSLVRIETTTTFEGTYERLLREGAVTMPLQDELRSLPPLVYISSPTVLLSWSDQPDDR